MMDMDKNMNRRTALQRRGDFGWHHPKGRMRLRLYRHAHDGG